MGLRLRFRLSAQGPSVRDKPSLLVDLVALLHRDGLIDDRGATLTVTWLHGGVERDGTRLSLPQLRERLEDIASRRPRSVEIHGLHTAERFPNPFWKYTLDEDVISAWINVAYVCQPPADRRFSLEFDEPDFLGDVPRRTPQQLASQLEGIVGTSLAPECMSTEPLEQERV